MKITVIGCWGGFPKANEASSGYLISEDGFQLLIDCGSGVLSKLQNYTKPAELDAVILSHYHADHIADIGVLQHALLIDSFTMKTRKEPLPIYGHQESEEFSTLTYKNITAGVAYPPSEEIQIGPFKATFLKTNHSVPCFAMRLEANSHTIVYTADTAYKEEMIEFAKGADILLAESNFYKGMDAASAGHMTSEEAGMIAQKAGVRTLVLTHLPHFGDINQLKEEAAQLFKGITVLARENLKIGL